MPIYEFKQDRIEKLKETAFRDVGLSERNDLQRLLRSQIEVVAEDVLIIAEEFGEWDKSRRRIDLLGVDRDANLVVFELKRTEDGGHMDLQAIRYAAMVSTMTFERATEVYHDYRKGQSLDGDAKEQLLSFLEWEEADEDQFAQDVRIILVSADFSTEITTSVLWLNDQGLDIRCVRLKPYADEGRTLVDVQQVIPLPEAMEYTVQIRAKTEIQRLDRSENKRRPRMTFKQLEMTANEAGVGDLYRAAVEGLCASFTRKRTKTSAGFEARIEGGRHVVFNLLPLDSSTDLGLHFQAYTVRLSRMSGLSRETIEAALPAPLEPWAYAGLEDEVWHGCIGHFTTAQQIHLFTNRLISWL
jgi:hypothetical protein